MTVPNHYAYHFAPIKYFLSSYRALSDGRSGIRLLEDRIQTASFPLFEWKISWIGTCSVLRTAIELFRVDSRSCICAKIRHEIASEWQTIKKHEADHPIFWRFLKHERDNIIHEYKWQAYEAWIRPDGTFAEQKLSLLTFLTPNEDGAKPSILMKEGHFKGRNSIDLLTEAADWVEERIFTAIQRAGYNPNEERNLFNFRPREKQTTSLLSQVGCNNGV